MIRISDVVKQALETGILTVEAEAQLQQLLSSHYDIEDLNAFMTLQHAAMSGRVKQQSRTLRQGQYDEGKRIPNSY